MQALQQVHIKQLNEDIVYRLGFIIQLSKQRPPKQRLQNSDCIKTATVITATVKIATVSKQRLCHNSDCHNITASPGLFLSKHSSKILAKIVYSPCFDTVALLTVAVMTVAVLTVAILPGCLYIII